MTTSQRVAELLVDGLCNPWPGTRVLGEPIARALAATLDRVYAVTGAAAPVPGGFDAWLAALVGTPGAKLRGEALASLAAGRLLAAVVPANSGPASAISGINMPTLPPVTAHPMLGPPPGPLDWTERQVMKALLNLGGIGLAEMATLGTRMQIATSFAATAVAMPGIRSTAAVGNRVHALLQGRYRSVFSPPGIVITDRAVYGGGFMGTPLAEAATRSGRPNLVAAYHAWLGSRWMSTRRSDITDLSLYVNFEIKPLLEAPIGVLQEAWYRCSYNFVAQTWGDNVPSLRPAMGWLLGGPPWHPAMLSAVPVTQNDQPALAVPFMTMLLPGMVLYAVVSGPIMADLAVFVALMLMLLERELKRRLELVVAWARALAELLGSFVEWLVANLTSLVVAIAIGGAIAALALTAPAWVTAEIGAGALLFIVSQLTGGNRGSGDESGAADSTSLTLDFRGLSVTLPSRQLTQFWRMVAPVITMGVGSLVESIKQEAQSQPEHAVV